MLISPLARKLCASKGIAPHALIGSGPRGRIMAADVLSRDILPTRAPGNTAIAEPAMQPTRPEKDGYYIYDAEADMKGLADISLPIAVQCEKLLENRYSLFDYIVRAVVKACLSAPSWDNMGAPVDVLLFEDGGKKALAIPDAARKSIYTLAREAHAAADVPQNYAPHIVICDSNTSRAQVAEKIKGAQHPLFAFIARGGSPKVGIRAGGGATRSLILPYTFYADSAQVPAQEANRIALRLQTLLLDPVSLLLLA